MSELNFTIRLVTEDQQGNIGEDIHNFHARNRYDAMDMAMDKTRADGLTVKGGQILETRDTTKGKP